MNRKEYAMLKNMLFTAMCVFCLAVLCFVAVLGGCGAEAVPDEDGDVVHIGDDATRIGRLEKGARVTATVYHAEGGRDAGQKVDVNEGTWLVPSSVFPEPEDLPGSGQ